MSEIDQPTPEEAENVVILGGDTNRPVPVNRVLRAAWKLGLKDVIVLGHEQNGEKYYATSETDVAEILLLIEQFKARILRACP